MDTPTNREALFEAIYGVSPVSKSKKKDELTSGDKALVATNAASAGFGALTLPALTAATVKSVKNKNPKIATMTAPQLKKLRRVPGGKKAAGVALKGIRTASHNPGKARGLAIGLAGTALGGQLFNTATDAASAYSISRKGKVQKSEPPMRKMKLKAMDATETAIKEQAPRAGNAVKEGVKAGAKTTHDTWKAEAKVSKAFEDKREVYGWASITELNGEPVVDMQGDYVTIEEIEKAAHAYITKSRKGGDMHRRDGDNPVHVADLIESVVITPEKKEALGLPDNSPTGWWVGMKVHDDETWALVKDGKRPMFSIHGSGRRIEKDM